MTDPVACPRCGEPLDIPAEYRGRAVRCGNCQTVFTPADDSIPTLPARPRPRPRPANEERPRRSNALVWVLLLGVVLAVGGCCGGLDVLEYLRCNPRLTPYTSDSGDFKVDFPAPNPTAKGTEVTASRPLGQERYTIKTYPLPAEYANLPADEALEKLTDDEVSAFGAGTRQRTDRTTHQNLPALDVYAESGKGLARRGTVLRCILAGRTVYVLAMQGQQADPRFWWVKQFFVSFTLTQPPKPD